ncbi:MAG: DUF4369 domain-containing protein [Prevotella sp.]|nr:DUF4369 domain-containing protein [Prevotella sp.]
MIRKVFPLCLLAVFLCACGVEDGHFVMRGEFKSFNQGELYIYNIDGTQHKLDTIPVINGRFTYQAAIDEPTTYVLVFPNFSELPILGESGKEVTVEGDASHLKEMEVKGTDENKLLTAFRLQTNQQTPPEARQTAAQFIKDHPQSAASMYILNKYFIQTTTPDYGQALELLELIAKDKPASQFNTLKKQLDGLRNFKAGGTLPRFTATDINGRRVSNADLTARVNVINTWASWNYDSQNSLRKLKRLEMEHAGQIKVVSICLDANLKDCRRGLDRDSIKWSCICDGRMWETPTLAQLGLYFVPDNIITDSRGKILAHSLSTNEIDRKIEELLR